MCFALLYIMTPRSRPRVPMGPRGEGERDVSFLHILEVAKPFFFSFAVYSAAV